MGLIRDYRADAERLRQVAREARPEGRQRLLQLAELYEALAKANEVLAQTPWPPREDGADATAAPDLLAIPITVQ
jgi:hypothetical protein